jgi:glycerate 2-kinase
VNRPDSSSPLALLAPDKFKGTYSAAEVCALLAPGVEGLGWRARSLPVADGGEGTAAALLAARGGEWRSAVVPDALGRPVRARYALLGDGETAVVEVAAASGLWRIAEGERDALAASSRGTGELILDAARAGARVVIVAGGGSATTDGGQGAIEALGGLRDGLRLMVACDVRTTWERAAEVFGPQKGASAAEVEQLAVRLDELAERAPRDPRGLAMSGCAGGLAGGLWAWHAAELVPGAALVLDAVGFPAHLAEAALVITGEGRIDGQTLEGKTAGEVAARCQSAGVPCAAVVGHDALAGSERRALGLAAVVEAGRSEELAAAPGRLFELLRLQSHPVPYGTLAAPVIVDPTNGEARDLGKGTDSRPCGSPPAPPASASEGSA